MGGGRLRRLATNPAPVWSNGTDHHARTLSRRTITEPRRRSPPANTEPQVNHGTIKLGGRTQRGPDAD